MSIKNIFSLPWSRKGFSMVGVLVAGGMMGGLAMVLADLTKKQHVAQKVAETGVEITALQGRVVSLLADGEACKKTLEGTAVNPPPAPAPGITGFKNRKGTPVLAVPSPPFNRLVKLNKVELVNIQGSGSTREVDVEITFEKLSKAIKGQKTVKRSVPLTLELDAANTITSCHSPQNYVMKEQLCSEMGGNWNGSNKKCSVPDCSTGQTLTKTSSGFSCIAASSLPTCIDGKFIKRVGGIWKCEDPPSGGGSNAVTDMNCGTDEAVTGFQGGAPVCSPVNTSTGNTQNSPSCPPGYHSRKCAKVFSHNYSNTRLNKWNTVTFWWAKEQVAGSGCFKCMEANFRRLEKSGCYRAYPITGYGKGGFTLCIQS